MKDIVTSEPQLRLPCSPIQNREEGRRIANQLNATLDSHNRKVSNYYRRTMGKTGPMYLGIGLAAPQIGIHKRVFVLSLREYRFVLVNPVLIEQSDDVVSIEETCLSFPDQVVQTRRRSWVKYWTPWGGEFTFGNRELREMTANEMLLAVSAQHEYAHLAGFLAEDFSIDKEHHPDPLQWFSQEAV